MPEVHKRRKKRRKRRNRSSAPLVFYMVIAMCLVLALAFGVRKVISFIAGSDTAPNISTVQTEPETEPGAQYILSKASFAVTGDVLMHLPIIEAGLQPNGSYQFDDIFRYIRPYTQKADFAAANLETTLCGLDSGYPYSGYPSFNCPDEIVDALKNAGFDALLTANNHCYDTKDNGFMRTAKTVRAKGLQALGTRESITDPRYLIQDINGIRVGMICYTYEGAPEKPEPGAVYMNRTAMTPATAELINSFQPNQLDAFYQKLKPIYDSMRSNGAEAMVIFMHWGTEYMTYPTWQQNSMAQQLCNMGFDVIVGGHPHVIQPVELLTSHTDPEHKAVCIFSTGNAVSNQRISEMDLKTGHTEDGVLFRFSFARYADNSVALNDVDLIPCWVDLRENGKTEYDIIPLEASLQDQWASLYGLDAAAADNAKKSFDRTMALTETGLNVAQSYLNEQNELRTAAFRAAEQ